MAWRLLLKRGLLKCKYQDPLTTQPLCSRKITKIPYKTKLILKLTQHSTTCFKCSKQSLAILINMQDPYLKTTSKDFISAIYWPNKKDIVRVCFNLLNLYGRRFASYQCVIVVTSLSSHQETSLNDLVWSSINILAQTNMHLLNLYSLI